MPVINCKRGLVTLKGEPLRHPKEIAGVEILQEQWTVGSVLAEILANGDGGSAKKFGIAKCFSIALRFFEQEAVELETSDFDILKNVLNESQQIPLLAGQVLNILLEETRKEKEQTTEKGKPTSSKK